MAEAAAFNLYKSGDGTADDLIESISMNPDVNGTWVVTKSGDLNGVYYTYTVTNNGKAMEACDPYARATGVNGERAMVIDLASTNPEGKWHVCINGEKAGTESIKKVSEKVSVEGISAMVLVQGENAVTKDAGGGNMNASEMVAYLGVAGAVIATSVVKKRKR